MNLQFLKYFVVLAEELHFSKAAEKLAITQPPLSLAMKSLEEELGAKLFHRNTKKVELTREGLFYLGEVRKIIANIENAKRGLHDISYGFNRTLNIGLSPSLSFRGVFDLFDEFLKSNNDIQVTFHEMPLMEQMKNLKTNSIDMSFCNSAFNIFEFNSKKLKNDYFCLCVYEGHNFYEASSVNAADINANELIAFERSIGPSNYDLILRICETNSIKPSFIVRTWVNAITFVSLKKGIAIVPQSMSRLQLAGIRYIPLSGEKINASAMMLWNKNKLSNSTHTFLNFLNEQASITAKYFEMESQ